jgi:HlyD family secretion protein
MLSSISSDISSLKIDRQAPPPRKRWLPALLTLSALGATFVGYAAAQPYLEAQFFKTAVEIGEITSISPAQASIALSSTGYVVPQIRSQVGARIAGRVAKLWVKEGDRVTAGQPLLELDASEQSAAVQTAKMRVATARARAMMARATLRDIERQADREQALVARSVAPAGRADDLRGQVSTLREQLNAARADIAAADSDVEALQVNLASMTLLAPISGVVLNKPPAVGEMLGNVLGIGTGSNDIVELADLSSQVVEADVPEGRLHLIKVGTPCEIVLEAYPEKRHRGEAIEILPRVNRAKATVGVKVKFLDDNDGALPDMAARVSFLLQALDSAQLAEKPKTVVPSLAITERGGHKVVFVVEGDKVRMANVVLGAAIGGGYELQAGPEPGTKVVTSPPSTLSSGNKIKEKAES